MIDQAKNKVIMAILLIVALPVFAYYLFNQIPSLVGSKEVAEESIPADTDFPVVLRTKGGMLEVATISGSRNFPKSKNPQILGQSFSYCKERASWTAPYKITYRVRLEKRWKLRFANGRLIARVPELEPALPVAIDTSRTKRGAEESCWFVPNMGTREQAFEEITPNLGELAKSQRTKDLARNAARKTIREFLRTWAFDQTAYPDLPPDAPIRVIFPGE